MKSLQICMLLKNLINNISKSKENLLISGLSSNSKNTLGYPSEDIMRHKPIIFMNNEIRIFLNNHKNYF